MAHSITFSQAPDQSHLNSYLSQEYKSELSSHKRWNMIWKVAALASVVAFAALAAVATALTYLTAPIYLPVLFTGILAFALSPAYNLFEWMWKGKAAGHREAAEELQPIVDAVKELPKSKTELESALHTLGVTEVQSDQIGVKQLKPALGRYQAIQTNLQSIAAKVHQLTQELFKGQGFTASYAMDKDVHEVEVKVGTHGMIAHLDRENIESVSAFKAVQAKFIELANLHAAQGKLRIVQAHLIHVMREPHDTRSLDDHCKTFEFLDAATRQRATELKDPHAEAFALRVDNQKAYTLEDLKGMTIVEMTEALFTGTGTE